MMAQTPEDLPIITRRAALGFGACAGLATLGVLGGLNSLRRAPEMIAAVKAGPPAPPLKNWPTLDALAERMVATKLTPGLSLSVMHAGTLLYARGFGVAQVASDKMVTPQTGFRIASITKHFTATGILLLAEAGKLSVSDPLSRFIPEFPRGNEVSLRQLLSHTSGLGDYINGQSKDILDEAQHRDYTANELLAVITRRQPLFRYQPGQTWYYSNSGFALLGIVIERVSGQAFADFMQQHLFTPAGLTQTVIDKSCLISSGCSGYRPDYLAEHKFDEVLPISPSFGGGAGAIRSTTNDLCLWQAALMGGKIVAPKSLQEMLTPVMLKDGTPALEKRSTETLEYGFGLGLGEQGKLRFASHGGRINGFTGHMRIFPDQKLTIAILYNSDGGGAPGFAKSQRGLRAEATALSLTELGLSVDLA